MVAMKCCVRSGACWGAHYPFPMMQVPKFMVWLMDSMTRDFISRNVDHGVKFDNRRSRELGLQYRPVEETFIEHFQQVIDDGLLKR